MTGQANLASPQSGGNQKPRRSPPKKHGKEREGRRSYVLAWEPVKDHAVFCTRARGNARATFHGLPTKGGRGVASGGEGVGGVVPPSGEVSISTHQTICWERKPKGRGHQAMAVKRKGQVLLFGRFKTVGRRAQALASNSSRDS